MTVREILKSIHDEVLASEDLLPDRAAELLAKLAALYGNCLDEVRTVEMAYNAVLLARYNSEKTANRAKVVAQADPSFLRLREAQDAVKLCLELIRATKYFLKEKGNELQTSSFQHG